MIFDNLKLLIEKFNQFYNEAKKYEFNKIKLRILKKTKKTFDIWSNAWLFHFETKTPITKCYPKNKRNCFYRFNKKMYDVKIFADFNFEKILFKNTKPKKINYIYSEGQRQKIRNTYFCKKNLHNISSLWIEFKKKIGFKKISLRIFRKIISENNNVSKINKVKHPKRKYNIGLGKIQLDVKILGKTETGFKKPIYIVDMIDEQSKVVYANFLKNQTTSEIMDFVKNGIRWFKQIKIKINRIRTDNAMIFRKNNFVKSDVFNNFLSLKKIKHEFIPLNEPQCNGCIERFHKTIDLEFVNKNFYLNSFEILKAKFKKWINFYNKKRNHFYQNLSPTFEKSFLPPRKYLNYFIKYLTK